MQFIQQIKQRLIDYIWAKDIQAFPRWKQKGLHAARIIHLIFRDFVGGQLTLRAMGLVYTTFLSMVPFIAISFSVLKGFGVQNQIEPMLLNFLAPLGEKGVEITTRIIEFVNNMKAGVLGSVGLALLLYTAVSLMQKIERSFNYIWHVSQGRPLAQRFSDYLSVILIGPVLIFTALGITASIASFELVQNLIQIQAIGVLFETISRLVPYVLVIVAFTLVYMLIPNTKVYIGSALLGGIVAGVLWESAGWIFASFVVNSAKYTAIYSVFASLIIFMIWLYVSWLILLIGCSIAFYFQHPEHRNLHSRSVNLSNRVKEKLAISVMALIGNFYYQKIPPHTIQQLASRLGVGVEACNTVIDALLESKLLVTTADDPPALVPAYAPERMAVNDIVNAVRSSGERDSISPLSLAGTVPVQEVYQRLEKSLQESLGIFTLKDLVEANSQNGFESDESATNANEGTARKAHNITDT